MKKFCFAFVFFSILSFFTFPNPLELVEQFTLENGMNVFLLEDSSEALIHIEVNVKAGFSSQTKNTSGFFYLYSDLIQNSTLINFDSVTCNSDSSRYCVTTTNQNLENTMQTLGSLIFDFDFSDELLQNEISKLKKDSETNSKTLSGFLNSAIESRIYSNAPWKHDSGIYPSFFDKNITKTGRQTLQQIAERFYTPQNSAIFISGNFDSEKILTILRSSFGRFYSTYKTPTSNSDFPYNQQKKFVIHSADFSNEISQIIIEYTDFSLPECDLFSLALNDNFSTFKTELLKNEDLNIPGADYIDVSTSHTKNSSRIVIQSLLQKPKNNKITSLKQISNFLEITKKIPEYFLPEEFIFAKQKFNQNFCEMISNSYKTMDTLSSFWNLEPFTEISEDDLETFPLSYTASNLFSQIKKHSEIYLQPILNSFTNEEPFVFVIISDDDFKKNKKSFENAGFSEISAKNASWQTMQMYKKIQDNFKPNEKDVFNITSYNYDDNNFYVKNKADFSFAKLSNEINVTVKQNHISSDLTLMIAIKGGKINSPNDLGFEEVMINLISMMIQREINSKIEKGLILEVPQFFTQSDINTSYIAILCNKDDFDAICDSISTILVYSDPIPAAADRAVSSRQYKKRLENGSSVNQMMNAAIQTIFGESDFSKIFDSKKEILQDTDYIKILNAYPDFLDASRYSIILSGNIPSNWKDSLEKSFGILSKNDISLNSPIPNENFPKSKTQYVKINHTFLTDIPAEKAGPQPEVLIPTTEFLDPVIFVFQSPKLESDDFCIFNAMLNYIASELQKEIDKSKKNQNSTVLVQFPKSKINYGFLIIQNVSHINDINNAYKNVIKKLTEKINDKTATEIKNLWIKMQLGNTLSSLQTAKLIFQGLEFFPVEQKSDFYLEEYRTIISSNAQNYFEVLKYFPEIPNLRLYSKDAKN